MDGDDGGIRNPLRNSIGPIVGGVAKSSILKDRPVRRNMATERSLIVNEKLRVCGSAAAPAGIDSSIPSWSTVEMCGHPQLLGVYYTHGMGDPGI
jgi:hypothetical protein